LPWDISLAEQALKELEYTGEDCNQILAQLVREKAQIYGMPNALNYVNRAQVAAREVNSECQYPILDHPDQV
jgi:hypothetical protein